MNWRQGAAASRFKERPATRGGRWSGWVCLFAFASLIAANILMASFEQDDAGTAHDIYTAVRLTLITIFAVGGVVALVLAARSMNAGERSYVVWIALVFGILATGLLIAEFTIME